MTGSGKKKLSTPARKSGAAKTSTAARGKSKSAKAGDGDGREKKGVVARAAARVGKAIRSVTAKVRPAAKAKPREKTPRAAKPAPKAARATRRDSDIPMDRIAETYTPEHTSVKSGMRGNGAGSRNDRNVGSGIDDDRWNDEDVITNKSGDPRIGTHGRTYEPGEARAVAANDRK
ncbi:MAG: hypothetical protein QOI24_1611 [Acidobacteriota bacterium]|jgi:hypothetical protein|nr:hypothetical protein [Acidobacteriota bacterium]